MVDVHEFKIETTAEEVPVVDKEKPAKTPKTPKAPKPPPARNPLLFTRHLYFNGWTGSEVTGVYYLNVLSKDNEVAGKPSPGSGFAVAVLKTICPYIEMVKAAQQMLYPEAYVVNSLALDVLYKPAVLESIDISRYNAFTTNPRDFSLLTFDDTVLTKAENPIGLSIRAMELMSTLKQYSDLFILQLKGDAYLDFQRQYGLNPITILDISDEFFGEAKGKPVLLPNLDTSIKRVVLKREVDTSLGVRTIAFPLQFSLNLPSRNAMKKMEGLETKVYLLTFSESPLTLRYFVGVVTNVGYMLLSNYYADKIYLDDGGAA
jgi:hypothetical protein